MTPTSSTGPVSPAGQSAHGLNGSEATSVLDAQEANLADYLNRPVHEILSRLGVPSAGQAASPASGPGGETPSGPVNPMDPTQLIRPVTDALGTLGPGQFGNTDPTQIFSGISQALESAGQSVSQAVSSLGGVWQGLAATSAGAKTSATLADGAQLAGQATDLGQSLTTAAASVAQAQTRLIAIVDEFAAMIAAIGPNIVFPWGIAAVIEAANEAVTEATEAITETQTTLAAQAAHVSAVGAPVDVTSAPELSGGAAAFSAPVAATPLAGLGAQAIGPLVQLASSVASPVMEGVSAVTGAVQAGATRQPPASDGSGPNDQPAGAAGPTKGALAGAGSKPAGGGLNAGTQTRLAATSTAPATDPASASARGVVGEGAPVAMSAGPMTGGAPMGAGARAGADRGHNAAAFLHTSDHGDEVLGDLGTVAPPVIGERDTADASDLELGI
ncbi:hypothetical protein [Mycobacterium sp. AZCC_0083]|uniref:hypothetical protein n=1 Tax=Mycobacterium sp. AZCC_0083 TaxID=2735882 RepID=UPI0016193BE9|nr:hypothetical protein [Mycobacterium sp. AZCC_0083]MBB5167584.1 uncharacterized protein YukE [Mycobacterium sp. AZCC_0083]